MQSPQSHEYKSVSINTSGFFSRGNIDNSEIDDICNKLGKDGWSLASTTPVSNGNVGTASLLLIFTRPTTEA